MLNFHHDKIKTTMCFLITALICANCLLVCEATDQQVYSDYYSFQTAIFVSAITTVVAVVYIPPFLYNAYHGKYTAKQTLTFGLISSFTISAYTLALSSSHDYFEKIVDAPTADFIRMLWEWSSVCTKIWKILIFQHTRWVLQIPNRSIDFQTLKNEAKIELSFKIKIASYFLVFSVIIAALLSFIRIVNPRVDTSSIFPMVVLNNCMNAFVVYLLIKIIIEINERSLSDELYARLRWCLKFESIKLIFSTTITMLYILYFTNEYRTSMYSMNALGMVCEISKVCSFLTFFPFSFYTVMKRFTDVIRYLLDLMDLGALKLDDIVTYRSEPDRGDKITRNLAKMKTKVRTVLDFGFEFTDEKCSGGGEVFSQNKSELSQEQQIIDQIGVALENGDILSQVIPPEFIKIKKTPFAAGGAGQVHKGVFCGQQVAVKKVFTQLSEGLLDEFNHEVSILNNLRGMPHIMLLHGVSFQMDQGERVFIMVLEWCPLSLAQLLYPDLHQGGEQSSEYDDSYGRSRPSNHWLKQSLLANEDKRSASSAYSSGGLAKLKGSSGGNSLVKTRSKASSGAMRIANNSHDMKSEDDNVENDEDRIHYSPMIFLTIMKQLVNALYMLHYKGYVHRDLKPQNILFSNPSELGTSLKLCDFGSARIVADRDTGRCSDECGISPIYSPPEVVKLVPGMKEGLVGTAVLSNEASRGGGANDASGAPADDGDNDDVSYDGRAFDMYSLGVIMWECWYQQEPKLMPPPPEENPSLCSLEEILEEAGSRTNQSLPYRFPKFNSSHQPVYDAMERDTTDNMLRKTIGGYRPPFNINSPFKNMPPLLTSLVTRLWSNQAGNRPTSSEVRDLIHSSQLKEEILQTQRELSNHQ